MPWPLVFLSETSLPMISSTSPSRLQPQAIYYSCVLATIRLRKLLVHTPSLAPLPPLWPWSHAPPPSCPGPASAPPSHPGPAASSTRVRALPCFPVIWSPTEEVISCDFCWSLGDFIEAFDDLADEGFVPVMGYQYKIGDHGSKAILTAEDEYWVFLGRVQKAPKKTRVFLRPTTNVRFLPLQFGSLH